MAKFLCEKCNKELDQTNFYTYKTGEKVEICKKCLTLHLDAFNETTYLWLLEKMDLPYVPAEWNVIRDRDYQKKGPQKFESAAVFGKYLSKMKLVQWRKYGWTDGPKLAEEAEERERAAAEGKAMMDAMYQEQYLRGEITEYEYRTLTSAASQKEAEYLGPSANPYLGPDNPFDESKFLKKEDLPSDEDNLTNADKVYLAMKWGRLYQPDEWVTLEKTYQEMMNSFDIQDADTINSLILICKTDLKMNQALDNNDIEGFQKLSKVSEGLRKTAKFTAQQNKEDKGNDYVDSVGELVSMCEKQGFIPRYATDIPQDKVDLTIKDQKDYIHKLVTQDLGFGQQIENALKKIEVQRQLEEEERQRAEELGDDYDPYYDAATINNDAFAELNDLVNEEKEYDDLLTEE